MILASKSIIILSSFLFISQLTKSAAYTLEASQESRCLSCIRNASIVISSVDVTKRCEGYYCGQFQISYTYWAEAGKPGNNQGPRDYERCARDRSCAEQTVRAYFKRFKRDCNKDGQIDCLDMAALHRGGTTSCSSDWFYQSRFWQAFNKTVCMTDRYGGGQESSEGSSGDNVGATVKQEMKNQSLTTECLECICDAVSGCNTGVNNCGSGTVCGPFAISQSYWKEGRRPGASWTACTRTKECSIVTVKNYMEKHKRDCNGDGFVTCEDYAAIHRRGPRTCSNRDLFKDHYWNKFLACRANQKPMKDVNMVRVGDPPEDLASRGDQSSGAPANTSSSTTKPLDASGSPEDQASSIAMAPTKSSEAATSLSSVPADIAVVDKSDDKQVDRPPSSVVAQAFEFAGSSQATHQLPDPPKKLEPSDQEFHLPQAIPPASVEPPRVQEIGKQESQPHMAVAFKLPTSQPGAPVVTPAQSDFGQLDPSRQQQPTGDHIDTMPPLEASNQRVGSGEFMHDPTLQAPVTSSSNNQNGEDNDAFASSMQADKAIANNFDKVVIGIVGSPDFSKSYPPIPEMAPTEVAKPAPIETPVVAPAASLSNKQHTRVASSPSHSKGPSQASVLKPHQFAPNLHDDGFHQKAPPKIGPAFAKSSSRGDTPNGQRQNDKSSTELAATSDLISLSSVIDKALNESNRIPGECLECICDASSNCDTTVQCISKQREKNRCGLYMISWNQFQESEISLVSLASSAASSSPSAAVGQSSSSTTIDEALEKMYYDCSTDRACAERLIHLYMEKHQKDCNQDGKFDCLDIAAIHRVGPENCNSDKFLSSQYWKDFNICYSPDRLTTLSPASHKTL